MLLMVGLGNPGAQYAGNRHNIGFMAVDEIARAPGFSPWSKKFHGEIADGQVAGEKVLLLKPQTFMNDSGRSVQAAASFYRISPDRIVVFHDELDLPPGKLRVKTGGGHGGHNGLRSIDAHLGKEYRRVRLGIGHPGAKERVNPHVLGDFAKADRDWLEPMLEAVARNADTLARGEDAVFMNKVTLATGGVQEPSGARGAAKAASGESHVRQARGSQPPSPPASGPMAGMLRRLLGGGDTT
ncbi:aminoacyl-tRNA hydrolase [Aureimonas flava]|uniref:Peptidyl-tRNA hydrolase n=1 Tax=Aureimonas flava TaxID=2320271 RepID=A0A3A1WNJ7_9HYPH|nr:aminoacyl-tRNA hydrolase [Aureimonas flava]RIY02097.1 aminoacyl-tRNA hydrolase [Aureimonas flava]